MWDTASAPDTGDLVCYVFHHWSGRGVDRSEIIVSAAGCTPVPRAEYDDNGLPAWFLFRSVPQRLCPQAGACTRCTYALGDVVAGDRELGAQMPLGAALSGFRMAG